MSPTPEGLRKTSYLFLARYITLGQYMFQDSVVSRLTMRAYIVMPRFTLRLSCCSVFVTNVSYVRAYVVDWSLAPCGGKVDWHCFGFAPIFTTRLACFVVNPYTDCQP